MSKKTTYLHVRVSESEAEMYRGAAEMEDVALSVWVRRVLRAPAKAALRLDPSASTTHHS